MTEKKLTVGASMKTVAFTVLACIGFFGLWGITFLLSLAFTLDIGLSLILGFFISAVTIFALITVLIPSERRVQLALSKKQIIGIYVAWGIIFVLSLPVIEICLPALVVVAIIVIYGTLKGRKERG